jgi:transposase InsO family protein
VYYTLHEEEQRAVLCLRRFRVSLDDIVDALAPIMPCICRSNVYRLLVRQGVSKLPKDNARAEVGKFKTYDPGYLHIDSFMLPTLDGRKRYCYVAIDRATRLVFLHVYKHKNLVSALDFLKRCKAFFPFRICKLLTDNGKEFAYSYYLTGKGKPITKPHRFGLLCKEFGIEHRRTRPYTPKTNGMVERMNGRIQRETVYRFRYRNSQDMLQSLGDWLVQYNFYRKNGRIGGQTPYQATCKWLINNPESLANETNNMLVVCSQPCGT